MKKWYFSGKGDEGQSSLFDGKRTWKSETVFELIGTLDELTANLGMAVSICPDGEVKQDLKEIQKFISIVMSIIAGVDSTNQSDLSQTIAWIEEKIRKYGESLENPQDFIFAGLTSSGAAIDISRVVARRAERVAVRYSQEKPILDEKILAILNRLSSLLFLMRIFVDRK